MFSKIIQLILVITSLSPVLLTFWFKEFSKNWNLADGVTYLLTAIILFLVLKFLLLLAKEKLEILQVSISEISNADNESIIFIFSYLIPLIDIDRTMITFLLLLFFVIIYTTNIYHFNPILGLWGYHQYQIKLTNGTNFILITKKKLLNSKQIKNVVQLTNYILMEKEQNQRE